MKGPDGMHITLISVDDEKWASGIRSISSVIRESGHKTTMIFAGSSEAPINQLAIREIAERAGDSVIIGISSMSRGAARAKQLIEGLRPLGRLIVWGGIHPTLFPEDCVSHVDLVCRGEGEEFMLDLVERVAMGRGFADIPNGAYLSNGQVVLNDVRPPISDLDPLPLLDYSFENEYILDQSVTLIPNTKMREKEGNILFSGSRGCNNNCAYCSNSQLKLIYRGKGTYVRRMSIPHFIKAAKEYLRLFPKASCFYFTDEDFFGRPVEEMREFAEKYSIQVGKPFECMAAPNQINDEKVALAVKAGMFQIDVGLESGSEEIRLRVLDRHITNKVQMRAANAISRYAELSVNYFLIIGNPYEGRQDLLEGIHFIEKIPFPYSLTTYNLVFLPGTKLYSKACDDGIIKGVVDSASNLDFLGGFDYRTHEWKKKNIYLNSILSLMNGKSTKWRVGSIPRCIFPFLCSPQVVDFCEKYAIIGKTVTVLGFIPIYPRRNRSD